jgi:hypothetical protein
MRCLGEFFGNIAKGVKAKPGEDTERVEVNRTVEESTNEQGMTLRRTVIDEVEVHSSTIQDGDSNE